MRLWRNSKRSRKRLKAFRLRRGYSQETLAKLAGVTRIAILQVENVRRAYLSLPHALKVADALGITVDELMRGDRLNELAAASV
jgi:transcriptional regulator with XRE-family HTH domain